MRIQPLSDLHLEATANWINPVLTDALIDDLRAGAAQADVNVTVLAGDILTGHQTIERAALIWPKDHPVVVVAGNHEFYGCVYQDALQKMRETAARYPNIHFLENEFVEIQGVVFLGCTLWVDGRLWEKPGMPAPRSGGAKVPLDEVEVHLQEDLPDFYRIKWREAGQKIQPRHTYRLHHQSVAWLREQFELHTGKRIVVVTHHAPSYQSITPAFAQDVLSAGFASHLEDLVQQSGAALWVHGHIHSACDYQIGQTRIVANCGDIYLSQAFKAGFRPDLVVEI